MRFFWGFLALVLCVSESFERSVIFRFVKSQDATRQSVCQMINSAVQNSFNCTEEEYDPEDYSHLKIAERYYNQPETVTIIKYKSLEIYYTCVTRKNNAANRLKFVATSSKHKEEGVVRITVKNGSSSIAASGMLKSSDFTDFINKLESIFIKESNNYGTVDLKQQRICESF